MIIVRVDDDLAGSRLGGKGPAVFERDGDDHHVAKGGASTTVPIPALMPLQMLVRNFADHHLMSPFDSYNDLRTGRHWSIRVRRVPVLPTYACTRPTA